ncbi:hypothetical protein Tco_0506758 [Tanacetum coccineum]
MTDDELCLSSTCIFNIICSLLILSPYFFKFISFFISPLHFSLLLLSIIATSLYHQKTIVDKLRPKVVEEDDEEFLDFEQSEIYNIVFHDHHHPSLINSNGNADQLEEQASVMENPEQKLEKLFEELDRFEDSTPMLKLPAEISVSRQNIQTVDLEACSSEAANLDTTRIFRRLESIKSDLEKASAMATTTTTNSAADDLKTNETENLVTVKSIISRLESSTTFGNYRLTKLDLEEASSTAISTSGDDENTLKSSSCSPSFGSYDSPKSDPEETEDRKTVENSVKSTSNSMRVELDSCNSSFGSYGSMRKEKEWKRTLACKLFEERRSLEGGGEGMDSLWEAYEDDNTNKISRSSKKKTNVKNNKAKTEFKYFDDGVSEDGDEFMGNGQLCCLKALKMSTGKMNLGMGKPNLVKISKALKGFGWLHHRHAKKC